MRWAEPRLRCVDLDALSASAACSFAALSPDERERAARYCFDRDRDRFIARRVALRGLLAARLHCPPAAVAFATGPNGKPELHGPHHEAVCFNCSHSSGLALFALADRARVGVDVERVRPVLHLAEVGRSHFTRREWSVIEAAAPSHRTDLFFRAWTLKEAYLKATGEGLARAPETIELEFSADGRPRLGAVDGDPGVSAHWSARSLTPAAGFIGAVVIERR